MSSMVKIKSQLTIGSISMGKFMKRQRHLVLFIIMNIAASKLIKNRDPITLEG